MYRAGLLSLSLALAAPAAATEKKIDPIEDCKKVAQLAEVIMRNRQSGISLVTMMDAAKGNELTQQLIIQAYELPKFTLEDYQQNQIDEFRDVTYLECVKTLMTGK